MISDPTLYSKYLISQGYTKLKQPKKPDGTKYTGEEFCEEFRHLLKDTRVVAHMGTHHTVAIINGKVCDTWNSTRGKVGNIWVPSNINFYKN